MMQGKVSVGPALVLALLRAGWVDRRLALALDLQMLFQGHELGKDLLER